MHARRLSGSETYMTRCQHTNVSADQECLSFKTNVERGTRLIVVVVESARMHCPIVNDLESQVDGARRWRLPLDLVCLNFTGCVEFE